MRTDPLTFNFLDSTVINHVCMILQEYKENEHRMKETTTVHHIVWGWKSRVFRDNYS